MQTYEQALTLITSNPNLNSAQRDDAYEALRRRAARGGVRLEPCERCGNDSFMYDDGALLCDGCSTEYGCPAED